MPSPSYCTTEAIHTKEIKCIFASNLQMPELNPVNGVFLLTELVSLSNFFLPVQFYPKTQYLGSPFSQHLLMQYILYK